MEIILTHIGSKSLPSYINITIDQIRKFNKNITLTFITHQKNFNYLKSVDSNINLIDENILKTKRIDEFLFLLKRDNNDFWGVTASRILYLEEYIKQTNKKNIIHFENDVLLYFNVLEYENIYLSLFKNLGITKGGYDRMMTGFFYINEYESLRHMVDTWFFLLKNYDLNSLRKKFGIDMIHEMALFFIYGSLFNTEYLNYFPILPNGEHSNNMEYFNSLFDPASYGQYIGGTDKDKKPGFLDTNHYIGKEFIDNPNKYSIIWNNDEFNNKKPYLKFNNQTIKINNLHIHSKNLVNFI